MAVPVRDKYFLKSLHEDIGLLDRKLAHLQKYETFASTRERETATSKMTVKRGQLVRTARELAESGIDYKPSEIPLSMREEAGTQDVPVAALAGSSSSQDTATGV